MSLDQHGFKSRTPSKVVWRCLSSVDISVENVRKSETLSSSCICCSWLACLSSPALSVCQTGLSLQIHCGLLPCSIYFPFKLQGALFLLFLDLCLLTQLTFFLHLSLSTYSSPELKSKT